MLLRNSLIILSLFLYSTSGNLIAQGTHILKSQAEELGIVQWFRDYDEAIEQARKEEKDIVILFQEVPGCATCRNYGHNVLSHPLMVEALENSFIPLAIFNNKTGKDRVILDKFNEPSWNNPVVRIIDVNGDDTVQRISNDYSALTLNKRLIEALQTRNKNIPKYIEMLKQELGALSSDHLKQKCYKMYCFWTGEKVLGKPIGVINVEAGFIGHSEVVRVSYDDSLMSEDELDKFAFQNDIRPLDKSKNIEFRISAKDQRYALQKSNYRYLPLSELQKTKINSALGSNQDADKYLSPKQKLWSDLLKENKLENKKVLYKTKLDIAWGELY